MTDIQKCKMCDGFGMVGSMLESETCPKCNGDRYEGRQMTDITFKPDQYVFFKDGVDVSQYDEEPGTMYVFAMYSSINPADCLIGEPWAEEGIFVSVDEIRPATEQEIAEYEGKEND